MRLTLRATCVLALCATAAAIAAEPTRHALDIRPIEPKAWQASMPDVKKVLHSAASELWHYFPGREMPPILVGPKGGPIVWFQRGPKGEYNVRLATGKTFWCQYAYQFAHEFCHILCKYEPTEKANKWFEESLCEMASLFALRRMAHTWSIHPPYPNWRDYSKALWEYADERIKKSRLPQGTTLAAWYREKAATLRKEPCNRELNTAVAVALLPLFEREPWHWAAVGHLNASPSKTPRTFEAYLTAWHHNTPETHRPFIRGIAEQFGIDAIGAALPSSS
ncbi:hypothetical protein HQ576_05840 [bacterium]|nr:hypothetical protein [bacterium]